MEAHGSGAVRSAETGPARGSFADKLNELFAAIYPAGSKPYSNRQIVAKVKASGGDISESYLSLLRSGERDNPGYQHILALADAFGVPASYFLNNAEGDRVAAELAALAALRDGPAQEIYQRTVGLSAQGLRAAITILDQVRQMEGLPPGGTAQTPKQ